MSKLREIYLNDTAIVEVPSSIEHLNGLKYFDLSRCNIKQLWKENEVLLLLLLLLLLLHQ